MASTNLPAGIVAGKRNREALEKAKVTDGVVFRQLKGALEATLPNGQPDWPTRLKAIKLYAELTLLDPTTLKKAEKTPKVPVEAPEDPIATLQEAPEDGFGVPVDGKLPLPKDRLPTLDEIKARQQAVIEQRNSK